MPDYFTTPFPFHKIIKKSTSIPKLDLEQSIRSHIQSLVLMRVGEFGFDKSLGFAMWDHDKQVFYHEKAPYYEDKDTEKGLLEQASARKYFRDRLEEIIRKQEFRLSEISVRFGFETVEGNMSVYQRKIVIVVEGRLVTTGKVLSPPFEMSILYTPFQVESNSLES